MNNIFNKKYFILIKKKKILFQALDIENKLILKKEIIIENNKTENINDSIINFLENYIFELEKSLKDFIKEINIIFESDLFFVVETSSKYNLSKKNFKFEDIN